MLNLMILCVYLAIILRILIIKKNVEVYTWSDIETLYKIMKFFEIYNLQSRKYIDFGLWCVVLKLHKLGYFYIKDGRQLVVEISNCINKKRYSTNENSVTFPSQEQIDKIFNQSSPFSSYHNQSHE